MKPTPQENPTSSFIPTATVKGPGSWTVPIDMDDDLELERMRKMLQ
jgi:hypothetical protein